VPIAYTEAIVVAAVGLAVNLVSAWLLREQHDHHHAHAHDHHHHDAHAHDHHAHDHGRRDNNLRAAYLHVLADASTSVLAIVGLSLAAGFGWAWIDPTVALVGSGVIAYWAFGLIRDAGAVLLDVVPDAETEQAIRARLETGGDRITDLHLWQVGPGHRAAVISIVTHAPQPPAFYKRRLLSVSQLSHVTVEVLHCE
jgi:cation diffusion facilitator family transporter